MQNVGVFTMELFAHGRCLLAVNSCQITQILSTDVLQQHMRYKEQPFTTI